MKLTHEMTVKHSDGLIDVKVAITNRLKGQEVEQTKRYTYTLLSEYDAEKFDRMYKRGPGVHGWALVHLKKVAMTVTRN